MQNCGKRVASKSKSSIPSRNYHFNASEFPKPTSSGRRRHVLWLFRVSKSFEGPGYDPDAMFPLWLKYPFRDGEIHRRGAVTYLSPPPNPTTIIIHPISCWLFTLGRVSCRHHRTTRTSTEWKTRTLATTSISRSTARAMSCTASTVWSSPTVESGRWRIRRTSTTASTRTSTTSTTPTTRNITDTTKRNEEITSIIIYS